MSSTISEAPRRPPKHRKRSGSIYVRMTRKELLDYCRELLSAGGPKALSYAELKKERGLYTALYRMGLNQKTVLAELGADTLYRETRDEFQKDAWGWNRIVTEARAVVEKEGFLPPGGWFQQNGRSALVNALYGLGRNWEDLRSEFDAFQGSSFVQSRNGMRWRSHPEASFSNFLHARGIEHKRGEKYPEEFGRVAMQSYGYYDLHFMSANGRWIDVEIWGGKPNGANAEFYAQKRADKEAFNWAQNPNFLGVDFADCFDDRRLEDILKPFIGRVEPFVFERSYDKVIQCTHWSNADELIDYCREVAQQQSDGKFPTEEWLRKRGKWRDRPGPPYNTLSIYIKTWIGGVRTLREILGQPENSSIKWDRKSALNSLQEWMEHYGASPDAVRAKFSRGIGGYSREQARTAGRLASALRKHVGPIDAALRAIGEVRTNDSDTT